MRPGKQSDQKYASGMLTVNIYIPLLTSTVLEFDGKHNPHSVTTSVISARE
jgi:hypothetical protein